MGQLATNEHLEHEAPQGSWNEVITLLENTDPDRGKALQNIFVGANQYLSSMRMNPIRADEISFVQMSGNEVGRSSEGQPIQLDSDVFLKGNKAIGRLSFCYAVLLHEKFHNANKVEPETFVEGMTAAIGLEEGDSHGDRAAILTLHKVAKHVDGCKGNVVQGLVKMHSLYAEDDMDSLARMFKAAYVDWKGPNFKIDKKGNEEIVDAFDSIFGENLDVTVERAKTGDQAVNAVQTEAAYGQPALYVPGGPNDMPDRPPEKDGGKHVPVIIEGDDDDNKKSHIIELDMN